MLSTSKSIGFNRSAPLGISQRFNIVCALRKRNWKFECARILRSYGRALLTETEKKSLGADVILKVRIRESSPGASSNLLLPSFVLPLYIIYHKEDADGHPFGFLSSQPARSLLISFRPISLISFLTFMSSVGHGRGNDIAFEGTRAQPATAGKARSGGDTNIYGLRIANMPASSDLPSSSSSSASLISTPFSCPQAPPFEYPYPTPNSLLSTTSQPSYLPPNLATFSFSLGLNSDGYADGLRGKGLPIWMSLSKTKGINDTKPPMPPGLVQKAAIPQPTSTKSPVLKDALRRRWTQITASFDLNNISIADPSSDLSSLTSFLPSRDTLIVYFKQNVSLSFSWYYERQYVHRLSVACTIHDYTVRLQWALVQ